MATILTAFILPWVGQWVTETIANSILDNISSQLNKQDIDKALKSAVTLADTQYGQVFSKCNNQSKRQFLNQFFQGQVLKELQKPLINQAINLDFLVFAFQEAVRNNESENTVINQDFIRPWLEVFQNQYLKKII